MFRTSEKIKMSLVLVVTTGVIVVFGLTKAENGRATVEIIDNFSSNITNIAVIKTLEVKHLDEHKEYTEILSTKYFDCEFYIAQQDPYNREYVKIDPNTHMLTSIAIDREDEVFSNMLVPQIQVKLELECQTPYILRRTTASSDIRTNLQTALGDRSYVLTSDIYFSPRTMMLSLIIDDVNDNFPQFTHPPVSDFIVGYPEADIASDIFPDYLIKANAVDKDAGLNAKIRYKIYPNDDFYIDSGTGEVYPFSSAMHYTDMLSLKIFATDRDGADDGKITTVDIIVKKISAKHLVLLTIEKEHLEEAEKTLDTIRRRTGIKLKVLRRSIVATPLKRHSNSTRQKSIPIEKPRKTMVLRCWIYAIDDKGKLMQSNLIETKIIEIGESLNLSVISYEQTKHQIKEEHHTHCNESNIITALIIVIVLILILLITIIVGFLLWYFLRHRKYKRMSTPSSSTTTISTISNEFEHHRNSAYDNVNTHFHKRDSLLRYHENGGLNSTTHKRSSILKGRSSLPESSDHFNKISHRLHGLLGDISEAQGYSPDLEYPRIPPDRRKSSVTFNDNVQFFNIDIDEEDEETVIKSRL